MHQILLQRYVLLHGGGSHEEPPRKGRGDGWEQAHAAAEVEERQRRQAPVVPGPIGGHPQAVAPVLVLQRGNDGPQEHAQQRHRQGAPSADLINK